MYPWLEVLTSALHPKAAGAGATNAEMVLISWVLKPANPGMLEPATAGGVGAGCTRVKALKQGMWNWMRSMVPSPKRQHILIDGRETKRYLAGSES